MYGTGNITEAEFNQTKSVQAIGLNYKQAVELGLFKRSDQSWGKIARVKDWAEYEAANEALKTYVAKKKVNGKTSTAPNTDALLEAVQELNKRLDDLSKNQKSLISKLFSQEAK